MNILGCLDTPTTGEYSFLGAHVESLSRDQRARLAPRYLGFVFQGFNLLAGPRRRRTPNCRCSIAASRPPSRREAASKALELRRALPIARTTRRPSSQAGSSSASRSRAPIVTEPAVLLADEPTATSTRNEAPRSWTCSSRSMSSTASRS
jgi:putative ABC transport system ATP-binding protein